MLIELVSVIFMQGAASGEFRLERTIDPYALCSCKPFDETATVAFTGIASDAEMTLGSDGRSAEARQATIFRVLKGAGADVPELAKVYHLTDPAKCGVKFDYGKRYSVVAIKKADGSLETNWCVLGKPREEKKPS